MSTHTYQPDPDDPGSCARCFLPRGNARHVDAPQVPDISEQRERPGLPPFQRHSDTSRQAALAVLPELRRLQQTVLDQYAQAGARGLTDEEMVRRLGEGGNGNALGSTVRPRRGELIDAGLVAAVVDNYGKQVTRRNRSGRSAVVYAITPAGRERAG